jgi:hypothetical protein
VAARDANRLVADALHVSVHSCLERFMAGRSENSPTSG